MIEISVIIVNWNTKKLLLDCVDSLYKTTHQSKIEIIVIDNASTDNSVSALRSSFPQVHVVANPSNLGFAKANNIGIMKAKGRFICLINSDVKVLDGALDQMSRYMDAHHEVGAVGPLTYRGNMIIQKNCRKFPTLRNLFCEEFFLNRIFPGISFFQGRDMIQYDYQSIMEIEALAGCFLMVRRDIVDQVGVLDERFFFYSEDVDWCKRIHNAGWKLIHYPKAQIIHYGRGSSSNAPIKFQLQLLKANWQYWRKHKSLLECFLFRLIKFTGTATRAMAWRMISLIPSSKQSKAKISATACEKMLIWLVKPNLTSR